MFHHVPWCIYKRNETPVRCMSPLLINNTRVRMVKEETKPATGFTVTSQLNEIKKHTTTRGVFNLRELRAHPEGFKSAADFLHGMELVSITKLSLG